MPDCPTPQAHSGSGYLIGGVPGNFSVSARLGKEPYFVVEADEYDTAFFDKRSKFVHYRPSTLILNNLEFDHADIFADLNAIETQFHHLMRCVPSAGRVVFNADSESISRVLARGCWSATTGFGRDGDWRLNDTLQLSGPSLSPTPPAGWVSDGHCDRRNPASFARSAPRVEVVGRARAALQQHACWGPHGRFARSTAGCPFCRALRASRSTRFGCVGWD